MQKAIDFKKDIYLPFIDYKKDCVEQQKFGKCWNKWCTKPYNEPSSNSSNRIQRQWLVHGRTRCHTRKHPFIISDQLGRQSNCQKDGFVWKWVKIEGRDINNCWLSVSTKSIATSKDSFKYVQWSIRLWTLDV